MTLEDRIKDAARQGYTCRVSAEGDFHSLDLMVRPENEDDESTHLDGCFRAICLDTGHMLNVNGWLFSVEPEDKEAVCNAR